MCVSCMCVICVICVVCVYVCVHRMESIIRAGDNGKACGGIRPLHTLLPRTLASYPEFLRGQEAVA